MLLPIPRTAPCPCGSGRRFKACHGRDEAALADPRVRLRFLERAAASDPANPEVWQAMLAMLLAGEVDDADAGRVEPPASGPTGMRVAVVSAYCREDLATLRRCHDSVLAQTHPVTHFMVADGHPRNEIDGWDVVHVRLSSGHADYGDTPRAEGGLAAAARGFDAVAYLDADNALRPRHVESLIATHHAAHAAVCCSGRTLEFPDGTPVALRPADDARGHVDTSTLLLTKAAFGMLDYWLRHPRILSIIGDRVFVEGLRGSAFAPASSGALTLRYAINDAGLYAAMGLAVPPGARQPADFRALFAWYRGLDTAARSRLDATLGFDLRSLLRGLNAHVPPDSRV